MCGPWHRREKKSPEECILWLERQYLGVFYGKIWVYFLAISCQYLGVFYGKTLVRFVARSWYILWQDLGIVAISWMYFMAIPCQHLRVFYGIILVHFMAISWEYFISNSLPAVC